MNRNFTKCVRTSCSWYN